MPGSWYYGPSPPGMLVIVLVILLVGNPAPGVLGLRTTSGSPCSDICNKESTNTTASEIVCLDTDFDKGKGKTFEDCVTCLLKSSFVDRPSGETDVNWGLYNLRYAFTSCVFGYPATAANISTPCTVGCQSIESAVVDDITIPSASNFDNWCSATGFADNVINDCEFCYNLTYQQVNPQVYMANFLESIRYNCHFSTGIGLAFDIAPSRIFTETLLPSSMSLSTSTSTSGSGVNLGVVIGLPIMGFFIILCSLGACCFFFIRWQRKRVGRGRYQDHLYARWNDTSISTPQQAQGGWGSPQQMHAAGYGAYDPGYGPGFGFTDNDGQSREVGYGHDYSQFAYSPAITESSPSTQFATPQVGGYGFFEPDRKQPYAEEITQSPPPPQPYVSPHMGQDYFEPDRKQPF
ncbi:uncharacterized protein N7482_001082 [Penicillium canariense]|uniref:Uncharacterized protein n=1 Tax=Penicillium canariense TaxID=189055 RepID=A0A9W9LT87_9EURO|nr:uncharacterized protein N7482_001082 [Penicillium canariense]KAJ5175205.1 hypothetical protein N7482_001082 [Penicillium canariense]